MDGPETGGMILEQGYHSVRDEIVRPSEVGPPTSLYFWDRWARRLGPNGIVLVLWFRARCVERRHLLEEFTMPPQDEILAALGLPGKKTLLRELLKLERFGFLERRRSYRWDDERRQTIHEPDRYRIAMVDPIAPEDEPRAVVMAAEKAAYSLFPPSYPQGRGVCASRENTPGDIVNNLDSVCAPRENTPGGCVRLQGEHTSQVVAAGGVFSLGAHSNVESNATDNVNVRAREEDSRRRALVDDLVEGLSDPGSRRFFALVATRLPEDMIRGALSEARQARQAGELRRSAGAYFTDLVKRRAAELGLELSRRRTPAC